MFKLLKKLKNLIFIKQKFYNDLTEEWDAALVPLSSFTMPPLQETGFYAIYLEKCVSTLQPGWTEGSNRAESAPEVDTGEQRARGQ